MDKWGKILSQADTFDGDYLKKKKGSSQAASEGSSDGANILVVAVGLVGVLAIALPTLT